MQFSLQLQPMNRGIDHTLLLSIAYQFCIVHPVHQLHFLMIFVQQFNSFLQLSFKLCISSINFCTPHPYFCKLEGAIL